MSEWWRLPAAVGLAVAAVHVAVGIPRRPAGYGTDALLSAMYRDPQHPLRRAVDDLEYFDGSDVLERHGVTVQ